VLLKCHKRFEVTHSACGARRILKLVHIRTSLENIDSTFLASILVASHACGVRAPFKSIALMTCRELNLYLYAWTWTLDGRLTYIIPADLARICSQDDLGSAVLDIYIAPWPRAVNRGQRSREMMGADGGGGRERSDGGAVMKRSASHHISSAYTLDFS
jgi:hypothetical protein